MEGALNYKVPGLLAGGADVWHPDENTLIHDVVLDYFEGICPLIRPNLGRSPPAATLALKPLAENALFLIMCAYTEVIFFSGERV